MVTNTGGTQEIGQPNQAVRVERADVAPTAPFAIDQATVRRLFGAALDAMPEPEIHFVLYFDEASDALNAASMAIDAGDSARRSGSALHRHHRDGSHRPDGDHGGQL